MAWSHWLSCPEQPEKEEKGKSFCPRSNNNKKQEAYDVVLLNTFDTVLRVEVDIVVMEQALSEPGDLLQPTAVRWGGMLFG